MRLSATQWMPILSTLALQMAILTVMIRRDFRAKFPFFFSFIIFNLISVSSRSAAMAYLSQAECIYLRWTFFGLGTLLSFAVMYEVFVHILKPYSALVDLGKLLFRWAVVFLGVASVLTAVMTTNSESDKILAAIQVLSRSCLLMQCGLLLLFMLFHSRLGLSWRSPAICIMVGFGTNASVSLINLGLQLYFPRLGAALDWTAPLACVAVHAAWFASLALPQPVRRTVQDSPTRLILQRWNEALMASPLMSGRGDTAAISSIESFLPGVERTVERVMARKMMH